jgi:hypothetical protein
MYANVKLMTQRPASWPNPFEENVRPYQISKRNHSDILELVAERAANYHTIHTELLSLESQGVGSLSVGDYAKYQVLHARAHRALKLMQDAQTEYVDALVVQS